MVGKTPPTGLTSGAFGTGETSTQGLTGEDSVPQVETTPPPEKLDALLKSPEAATPAAVRLQQTRINLDQIPDEMIEAQAKRMYALAKSARETKEKVVVHPCCDQHGRSVLKNVPSFLYARWAILMEQATTLPRNTRAQLYLLSLAETPQSLVQNLQDRIYSTTVWTRDGLFVRFRPNREKFVVGIQSLYSKAMPFLAAIPLYQTSSLPAAASVADPDDEVVDTADLNPLRDCSDADAEAHLKRVSGLVLGNAKQLRLKAHQIPVSVDDRSGMEHFMMVPLSAYEQFGRLLDASSSPLPVRWMLLQLYEHSLPIARARDFWSWMGSDLATQDPKTLARRITQMFAQVSPHFSAKNPDDESGPEEEALAMAGGLVDGEEGQRLLAKAAASIEKMFRIAFAIAQGTGQVNLSSSSHRETHRSLGVFSQILRERHLPIPIRMMILEVLAHMQKDGTVPLETMSRLMEVLQDYFEGRKSLLKDMNLGLAILQIYQENRPEESTMGEAIRPPSWLSDGGQSTPELSPTAHLRGTFLSLCEEAHHLAEMTDLSATTTHEEDAAWEGWDRGLGFVDTFFHRGPSAKTDLTRLGQHARLLTHHPEVLSPATWPLRDIAAGLPASVARPLTEAAQARLVKESESGTTSDQIIRDLERFAVIAAHGSDDLPLLLEELPERRAFRVWTPGAYEQQTRMRLAHQVEVAEVRPIEELFLRYPHLDRNLELEAYLQAQHFQHAMEAVRQTSGRVLRTLAEEEAARAAPPSQQLKAALSRDLPPEQATPAINKLNRFLYEVRRKSVNIPEEQIQRFLTAIMNYHTSAAVRVEIIMALGNLPRDSERFDFIRSFDPTAEKALGALQFFLRTIGVATLPHSTPHMENPELKRQKRLLDQLRRDSETEEEFLWDAIAHWEPDTALPFPFHEPTDEDRARISGRSPPSDRWETLLYNLQYNTAAMRAAFPGLQILGKRAKARDDLAVLTQKYLHHPIFKRDLLVLGTLLQEDSSGERLNEVLRLIRKARQWDEEMSAKVPRFRAPGLFSKHAVADHEVLTGVIPFPTRWELRTVSRILGRGDLHSFYLLPDHPFLPSADGVFVDTRSPVAWEAKSIIVSKRVEKRDQWKMLEAFHEQLRAAMPQVSFQLPGKRGRAEIHMALRHHRVPEEHEIHSMLSQALRLETDSYPHIDFSIYLSVLNLDGDTTAAEWRVMMGPSHRATIIESLPL